MNKPSIPTLADSICDLRAKKIKSVFFNQMNKLLDWGAIKSQMLSANVGMLGLFIL